MATRNPAITRANFSRVEVAEDGAVMTLGGTMRKTFILLAIMSAGMLYVWEGMPGIGLSPGVVYGLFIVGFVVGVGLLLYTTANPQMARATGPVYAAIQGLVLGALTLVLSQNPKYKGLPIAAAALTVATLARSLPSGAALAALVDESAFIKHFGAASIRLAERWATWRRILATRQDIQAVFVSLEADEMSDARRNLSELLDGNPGRMVQNARFRAGAKASA